jgi:hypothetical protein
MACYVLSHLGNPGVLGGGMRRRDFIALTGGAAALAPLAADLVAQPIARRVITPDQPNRAYDIIEKKFRKDGKGNATGYGLKIFP